jgi:hypothetical protein
MAENDSSWFPEDPPPLKLRRGKQFMPEKDSPFALVSFGGTRKSWDFVS